MADNFDWTTLLYWNALCNRDYAILSTIHKNFSGRDEELLMIKKLAQSIKRTPSDPNTPPILQEMGTLLITEETND